MKLVKKDENLTIKEAFLRYQRGNKIRNLSEMTIDFKYRNFLDFINSLMLMNYKSDFSEYRNFVTEDI